MEAKGGLLVSVIVKYEGEEVEVVSCTVSFSEYNWN